MITNLPEATLAKLGRRYNPGRLMEQADVTLELAAGDGPALAALLPSGYLAELRVCYQGLQEALGDQTLAKEDSRQATKDQDAMIARAQIWRRKVTRRAAAAKNLGMNVPTALLRMGRFHSLPKIQQSVDFMTSELEKHGGMLPGAGVKELAAEGAKIGKLLAEIDADQELKRLSAKPEATRQKNIMMGTLFTGLQVINLAGCELHTGNKAMQKAYSTKILMRRLGRKKKARGKKKVAELKPEKKISDRIS